VNLSSGAISYLVTDALGSVRGVVGSSGSLAASTSYDAWGNPETSGGLSRYTPFGYAGGYTDPTGLLYLVNRYYDPQTGQFLTIDPDVASTGEPYGYASDDPVDNSDPSGLCTLKDGANLLGDRPCPTDGKQALAFEAAIRAQDSPGGWLGGLRSLANYAAGIGNFFVSTATLGHVHVSAPYCGYGFGSNLGYWYGVGATALLGGGEAAGADAAATEGEQAAILYRAVEPEELADIEATGSYRVPEGIGEGKYFYPTPEQASNFAEMNPGRSYTLTWGEFSPDVLKASWSDTVAREGLAYFIPSEYFPSGPVGIGGPLPFDPLP
jgi:RHS repeat-associated protein